MSFNDLHLAAPLLAALKEQGYSTPTPIQAQAIPAILAGRDVLGCAQTGTGKTAAFALPVLHRLLATPADKSRRGPALPRALILAPTRELAEQIGESFATYGRHTGLVHTCIYGGVSQFHQVRALHRGVDILVATPGRLEDLMQQQIVTLKEVRVLILDEADRMLDMGFIQPIRRIAAAVPSTPEKPRHTLLFSATMPKEIMHLADSLLKNPVKVAVTPVASAAPLIAQSLYMVPKADKQSLLHHLLKEDGVRRAVVFTKTKFGADRVSKRLRKSGIPAGEIHGNKAQNQRTRALDAFREGRTHVLVATDVAARGLDVDGITHVFNFDLPMEPESYVHRIGRTGRAGATGIAISFCDNSERGLLKDIERLTGTKIPVLPVPADIEQVDGTPEPIENLIRPGATPHAPRKPLNRQGSNKLNAPAHPARTHPRADDPAKPQRTHKDAAPHHHPVKPHPTRADRTGHAEHAPVPHPAHPGPAPSSRASHAPVPLTDPIKAKPAKTPHDHPAYTSMIADMRIEPLRPMPKHQPAVGTPRRNNVTPKADLRSPGKFGKPGTHAEHRDARTGGKFARPEKPAHPLKGGTHAPRAGHAPRPLHATAAPGAGKPSFGKPGRPTPPQSRAGHAEGNRSFGGGHGQPRANTKRSRPWR